MFRKVPIGLILQEITVKMKDFRERELRERGYGENSERLSESE